MVLIKLENILPLNYNSVSLSLVVGYRVVNSYNPFQVPRKVKHLSVQS